MLASDEQTALVSSSEAADQPAVPDEAMTARFERSGFVILPSVIPDDLAGRVRAEVDRWVDTDLREKSIAAAVRPETHPVPDILEVDLPAHGELLAYEPLLRLVEHVLGPGFAFHHMHSDRHEPDRLGKPWHHDYEHQGPPSRTDTMVHVLHYLDGIQPDMAGLALLPGSHMERSAKTARLEHGTEVLPGEVFIEYLPPGSSVLLHSALFHARRAKPASVGPSRYFVDTSYCQAGKRWLPVKPYWREVLRRARHHGLGSEDRPDLFAEHHFLDYVKPE